MDSTEPNTLINLNINIKTIWRKNIIKLIDLYPGIEDLYKRKSILYWGNTFMEVNKFLGEKQQLFGKNWKKIKFTKLSIR